MSEQTRAKRAKNWMQTSITFRMAIIGILILVLLIPLSFIKSLIRERKQRQQEVVSEINKSWGNEITLYGPILKIPYFTYIESTVTDAKTKKVQTLRERETNFAYFFPNQLNVTGNIDTELKKLGIYSTSVYKSVINIKGNYTLPDFSFIEIPDKDIVWEKSQLILQTTNLKGLSNEMQIQIGIKKLVFESKFQNSNHPKPIYNKYGSYDAINQHLIATKTFNLKEVFIDTSTNFNMSYNASGSSRFRIIPVGKETKMHITSNWKDASFKGEYLPNNPDKLNNNGFDAYWKVLQMNRPFPQQFESLPDLQDYSFGVDFFIPVDDYQQNERSAKYGYLMIALTFLLFFLIQTLSKIYIHPFQYLMIGLALVIFYTLLISISEHSNFTKAYLIAGSAVVALITFYSKSIMKMWKFPLFIGVSLTALYSFIFVIIQLENYALLVGSIGLFLILALVMYASRKIDWS